MNDKTLNEVIEILKDTIKTLQAEIEFWRNHAHGLRAEAKLWQAKAQRGDERIDALVAEVERLRAAIRRHRANRGLDEWMCADLWEALDE